MQIVAAALLFASLTRSPTGEFRAERPGRRGFYLKGLRLVGIGLFSRFSFAYEVKCTIKKIHVLKQF